VTLRAIAGLFVLHGFLLVVGAGVLWGVRGWRWWTELARLAGLAYLLGLAAVVVVLTLELVVGIPFEPWTILASGALIVVVGLLVGRRAHRARPGLRPPGWRPPVPGLVSGFFLAAIGVYFLALFRSERLAERYDWDAWFTWSLKSKALHFFGGLEEWIFGVPVHSGGVLTGYPPAFPELEAASFHAMGSADVVTSSLNYWFLTLGFASAVAGLLAPRVRGAILLPGLLLVLVLPGLTGIPVPGGADRPLAFLIAVAALLVVLWIDERERWQLAAATLLLAGAFLTKREGLLLGACIVLAAVVATWGDRRVAWPRLVGAAAIAFALSLPWRVWVAANGYRGDEPQTGFFGFLDDPGRGPRALWLALRAMFGYDFWLVLPVVAVAAAVLAFLAGARRPAVFAAVFLGAAAAGNAWITWTHPLFGLTLDYSLNPATRFMVTPLLAVGAITPLLLERAWARPRRSAPRMSRSWIPWALVAAAILVYPASMLAGYSGFRLPGGAPPFPSRDECVREPIDGQPVRVVVGYAGSYPEAERTRRRAAPVGRVEVARDGCGRLRVFVDDVPTMAAADEMIVRAVAAGLDPSLEHDPDD
jgi:4-amino-4-deoxy-L-arabinose transferase-like glycosyltransferase